MELLLDVFQQVMLMLPMVVGIFISYRLLKITDLSVEASFVLGACVFAKALQVEVETTYAIFLGLLGGAFVGILVSIIHRYLSLPVLISGILMIFMFQSVNFLVMGKPNIQIIRSIEDYNLFSIFLIANILIALALIATLKSKVGDKVRAVGSNLSLARRVGFPVNTIYIISVITSNTLASISGVMHASYGGFSDVYMGVGVSLIGVASLMIGVSLMKADKRECFSMSIEILSIVVGVAVYSFIVSTLLNFGLDPIYLKFMLGLVVLFAIYSTNLRRSVTNVVI